MLRLYALLLLLPLRAFAGYIVFDITGSFVDPVGGVNSGVGSSSFYTGEPIGSGGQNYIDFTPLSKLDFPSATAFDSTEIKRIGIFTVNNGQTVAGTAATRVTFKYEALLSNYGFDPAITVPVGGFYDISFLLTPNTTGDPHADRDFWFFAGVGYLGIDEDVGGQVAAYGRLVPQHFGSPPKDFLFELTSLQPLSPGLDFQPVPEPSSFFICLSVFAILGSSRRIVIGLRPSWRAFHHRP